ncbi:MAG TPA: PKD domain-containing protein, partial [Perlabentimonas sp.]|nr:PKD domain-containing protein [Perlabentimonas sp.]
PKDEDFRYEVTLAISNEKCADTLSQKFTILPPEPISLFSANEYRACSPLEVNFYNESLFYLTDEDATAFEWRIDGEEEPFSTAFEPRWTFTEPGYYNVQLTVYGDGGEKHSYRTFRVYENPKASFEAMPERVTLPNARVHFYNFSERADSCIWVFGDNSFESNDWDPVHTYTEMGEYRVTLTAFSLNDDGTECVDIYSKFPAVWVLGSGRIRFPNAFVPSKLGSNGGVYDAIDYKNEVFHPVSEGVMEYRLQIFNRWGEQIFESNDINIGWDGYYKGKLASQGVYVWRAVGRFANGDMFDKRGNVTLLR